MKHHLVFSVLSLTTDQRENKYWLRPGSASHTYPFSNLLQLLVSIHGRSLPNAGGDTTDSFRSSACSTQYKHPLRASCSEQKKKVSLLPRAKKRERCATCAAERWYIGTTPCSSSSKRLASGLRPSCWGLRPRRSVAASLAITVRCVVPGCGRNTCMKNRPRVRHTARFSVAGGDYGPLPGVMISNYLVWELQGFSAFCFCYVSCRIFVSFVR